MEQVRSFIAIEIPDELKTVFTRLQDRLKLGKHTSVKWVNPRSMHLTLKFLGNIDKDRINSIVSVMEAVVQGIAPFRIEVNELGGFPNLRRVQVVWVGIGGEMDKISRLQQQIESGLFHLGFAVESRPFTPHLTLARLRERASLEERQSLGQLIADSGFKGGYTINVEAISLMMSRLSREGAIYKQISSTQLKKNKEV
jgi:2'-5' RNA ligase